MTAILLIGGLCLFAFLVLWAASAAGKSEDDA